MTHRVAQYFDRIRGRIEPGSHRIHSVLPVSLFTHPIPTILVGGSNGKGTTCAYLESILRHNGYKTGLFTSPHLVNPNERIRIAGIPVSDTAILSEIQNIDAASQGLLSFFELLTACALRLFYQDQIEVLICEVGLGGRYDSTNAIAPSVSVLTSVSLEHTTILGSHVSEIAFDKAHIGRRNSPLIIGDLQHDALLSAQRCAHKLGYNLVKTVTGQNPNLDLALMALKIFSQRACVTLDPIKTQLGIQQTQWPGRFDSRRIDGRQWLFDVCHNPEGADFFLKALVQSKYANDTFVVLFGIFSDKDWQSVLTKIQPIALNMVMTRMDDLRSVEPELLAQHATCPSVHRNNLADAIALATALSDRHHKPLLVIGSVALVGSVMQELRIRPLEVAY